MSQRFLRFVIALVMLALVPRPAAAQEQSPITWQITPGFNGSYKAGAWLPFTITVANAGDDVRGTITVQFLTGQAIPFSQTIDLPRGAEKQIMLPVASDTNQEGQVRAQVELRDGDTLISQQRVDLTALNNFNPVLGIISDEGNPLPELATIRGFDLGNLPLLRVTSATLPERAELLQSFDALFVHAVDARTWSDAQRAALQTWVRAGGVLVLGGDDRIVAGLDQLLPATAQNVSAATSPSGLSIGTGWPLDDSSATLTIQRLEPRPGAEVVLRGDNDLPLLVRQQIGAGTIVQAAFDLAALSAAGDPATFWPRVVPINQQRQAPWQQLREQGMWTLEQSLELPALRLPSILGLLGFLLAYIAVVGPLNYLILRRFDRREWAYLTIPVFVLLFSGGAYVWGAIGRGQSALVNELAIVQTRSGANEGQAISYVALFSPVRASYDVAIAPDALVSDLTQPWQRQGRELTVLRAEDSVRVPDFLIDVGAARALSVEQSVAVPELEAVVRGKQITLRNRSQQRITDVVLARGDGRMQNVGVVEPNAERTLDLRFDLLQGGVFINGGEIIDRQAVLNQLGGAIVPGQFAPMGMAQAIPAPGQPAPDQDPSQVLPDPADQIQVLGWTSETQVPITIDGQSYPTQGETLFVWSVAQES